MFGLSIIVNPYDLMMWLCKTIIESHKAKISRSVHLRISICDVLSFFQKKHEISIEFTLQRYIKTGQFGISIF